MQPTAEQVADAIEWLEEQMTELDQKARAAGRTCSKDRMLQFLGAVEAKEAPPTGVSPDSWAATRWAVERLTAGGTVNISRASDGRIYVLQTAPLFRGLAGRAPSPPPEDDFGELLA